MRFTLVVPGLLDWPLPALASIEKKAPALARLVAAGGSPASEQDGSVATACRVCGIAKQQDWPVAPWLARAQGIDTAGGYWLCAEPARFVVGHSDVRLAALIDDIEPAEAESLLVTLNAHFAAERIRFVAPTSSHWFVCAENPARISTRPPEAALGAPLLEYLAAGPDGSRWRRWQNELQMPLFEHAVNRRREANGHAPIDGVWLWGGGTLVQPAVPDSRIFADGGLVRVLGTLAGLAPAPLPAAFDALPQTAPPVVWLDSIAADAAAQLSMLEHAWTAPAERALRAGTIDEIELVLTASAFGLDFRIPRPTLVQRLLRRFVSPRVSPQLARWVGEAHGT
jgi:hypothetical protein